MLVPLSVKDARATQSSLIKWQQSSGSTLPAPSEDARVGPVPTGGQESKSDRSESDKNESDKL